MTQSIAIIDSMFNFGKFFTKNDVTFDLTEKERKYIFVNMKFCCASNDAIKLSKSQEKINHFPQKFQSKCNFPKKHRFLEKITHIFFNSGSSRYFDYLFTF